MKTAYFFSLACIFLSSLNGLSKTEAPPFSQECIKKTICLDGHHLIAEIADTPELLEKGLMGRPYLDKDHGMLFVFKKPQILYFWMKNTLIPLSIGFFDESKQLTEILDMPLHESNHDRAPIFKSKHLSCYALEVPAGWFDDNKVYPGAKFSFHDQKNRLE